MMLAIINPLDFGVLEVGADLSAPALTGDAAFTDGTAVPSTSLTFITLRLEYASRGKPVSLPQNSQYFPIRVFFFPQHGQNIVDTSDSVITITFPMV
jgi:hypothetical protein